jgi:hypothetical protein
LRIHAASIAGLKKDAMVEHAERLLAGTGWLPALLRTEPLARIIHEAGQREPWSRFPQPRPHCHRSPDCKSW